MPGSALSNRTLPSLKAVLEGKLMWENPVTYAVILAAIGGLFSIGIWVGRMNAFKSSVEQSLVEIKESLADIQDSLRKILLRLPSD